MIFHALESKYKSNQNVIYIKPKDFILDTVNNSYYYILNQNIDYDNILQQNHIIQKCYIDKLLDLTYLSKQLSIDITQFYKGGFVEDIYGNKDLFFSTDILTLNNNYYLKTILTQPITKINIVQYDNTGSELTQNICQNLSLENQTQYKLLNIGKIDLIEQVLGQEQTTVEISFYYNGLILSNKNDDYNTWTITYNTKEQFYQNTIILNDQLYLFIAIDDNVSSITINNYEFNVNYNSSKIIYFLNDTLNYDIVERGVTLNIDGKDIHVFKTNQLSIQSTLLSNDYIYFPYGINNNNLLYVFDSTEKFINNTFDIEHSKIAILISNIYPNETLKLTIKNKIHEKGIWYIQQIYLVNNNCIKQDIQYFTTLLQSNLSLISNLPNNTKEQYSKNDIYIKHKKLSNYRMNYLQALQYFEEQYSNGQEEYLNSFDIYDEKNKKWIK